MMNGFPRSSFREGLQAQLAIGDEETSIQHPRISLPIIIVKQTSAEDDQSRQEKRAHDLLKTTDCHNIVKAYRLQHQDVSQGTRIMGDGAGMKVCRIYLEYCLGSDMNMFIEGLKDQEYLLEEEDVWHIFHGLALACSATDRGTISLQEPRWEHQIYHLDFGVLNGRCSVCGQMEANVYKYCLAALKVRILESQ